MLLMRDMMARVYGARILVINLARPISAK